jgi:AbrB family looped-hinge helix DNA binding protein
MAELVEIDTRLSPEGRVVVPAQVRAHLGVHGGDTVRFVMLEDGRVEIVTPRLLAMALWANNHGGDAVDSTEVIRAERLADQRIEADAEAHMAAANDEAYDEAAATSRLLAALGMAE